MDPVSFIAGLIAGGFLVWLIHEVKDSPVAYQTEEGYGPVDLATLLKKADTKGYWRGRQAGIEACHPRSTVRVRGSAVGEEASVVELAEWAESHGRGDVA